MILPNKHITILDSYLGIGAQILNELESPKTTSELWKAFRRKRSTNPISLQRFYLTLDFLFTLRLINFTNGTLHRRNEI